MMAGPGWIETGLHVPRTMVGGVFAAHPGLQIVVGHMSKTLPFALQRVDGPVRPFPPRAFISFHLFFPNQDFSMGYGRLK
jgi:predicted TIM-barrel fold metal-dependent hydrolase